MAAGSRFSPDLYHFENRNGADRAKDSKRPVYVGFLEWMTQQPDLPTYSWQPDKAVNHSELFEAFPEAQAAYSAKVLEHEKRKAAKRRFHGKFVSSHASLTGKSLGDFMAGFSHRFPNLLDELDGYTDDDLVALVKGFFANGSGTPEEPK